MDIHLHIEKKHFYVLLAVMLLSFGTMLVLGGHGTGDPATILTPVTGTFHYLQQIVKNDAKESVDFNNNGVIDDSEHSISSDIAASALEADTLANTSEAGNSAISAINNAGTTGIISASRLPPTSSSIWLQSGSDIYYNSGNVGIGVTNPQFDLHVRATGETGGLMLDIDSADPHQSSAIYFASKGTARSGIGYYPFLDFMGFSTGGRSENDVIIDSAGNVGIGTIYPSAKLEVNGKIKAQTPLDSDPDNIVATKGYVDAAAGGYVKGGRYGNCIQSTSTTDYGNNRYIYCTAVWPAKCTTYAYYYSFCSGCEEGFTLVTSGTDYYDYGPSGTYSTNTNDFFVCVKQ